MYTNSTFFMYVMILCLLSGLTAFTIDKTVVSTSKKQFHKDYTIDLRQDGYLIKDQDGNIHYVPRNELETWFLDDNL